MALVRKQFATDTWATGATGRSIKLDCKGVLVAVELRLTGSHANDNTADLTAVIDGGFRNLVKNIALVGDGSEFFITNVNFKEAVDRTRLVKGVDPDGGEDLVVTKNDTYTCDLKAVFDFRMDIMGKQGGIHPWAYTTELPAGLFETLELQFDWAAIAEVYTVGSAVVTESYTLTVIGVYDLDADPKAPRHRRRYTGKKYTFTSSTGADIQMFELKGNYMLRDVFLRNRDTSAASNDVIGNIDHVVDYPHRSFHPVDEDFEQIQRDNRDVFGIANETGCCLLLLDRDNTGNSMVQPNPKASTLLMTSTSSTSVADSTAIIDAIELNAALLKAA